MAKTNVTTPDVEQVENKQTVPNAPVVENEGQSDIVKTMLEQNAILQKQLAEMNRRIEAMSKKDPLNDVDFDPDDLKRRPPEGCYLRCVNGSPVVKTKLSYTEDVDKFGNVHQTGATIKVQTLNGEESEMPYGSTFSNDYLNLEKKYFAFANAIDETGASKIDKGVIIEKGQIVMKRNPGEQVFVDGELKGGQNRVQQVVRKDIRYYTIVVDGKEHEVIEDVLSK